MPSMARWSPADRPKNTNPPAHRHTTAKSRPRAPSSFVASREPLQGERDAEKCTAERSPAMISQLQVAHHTRVPRAVLLVRPGVSWPEQQSSAEASAAPTQGVAHLCPRKQAPISCASEERRRRPTGTAWGGSAPWSKVHINAASSPPERPLGSQSRSLWLFRASTCSAAAAADPSEAVSNAGRDHWARNRHQH